MTSYRLDHLVLTVHDIERSCQFYQQILNISVVTFGVNRKALQLHQQKINFHSVDSPIEPHAQNPTPGSADLCLVTETPLEFLLDHLQHKGVAIEMGPVNRTGAQGPIRSIYIRDPDQNLIELSNPLPSCFERP